MSEQTYKDGDELIVHLSSMGATLVPLPEQQARDIGVAMTMDLNMMSAIYRGEDDRFWHLDMTNVDPPLTNSRLLKDGVDLIGVKSTVEISKMRLS